MQKARRHPGGNPPAPPFDKGSMGGVALDRLRPLVGMWFQVHCPPLIGVLPIVRSRYWFTIGRQGVLSLARWTSRIQACFHVSSLTQVPDERVFLFAYGTITLYGRTFQNGSARVQTL